VTDAQGSGGLLLVHAHPDDEAMSTGGTMARCVAEGRRVDLVTCTGGEEGEIHDPTLDPAEAAPRLAEIRAAELDCSLQALGDGAIVYHPLGYRDSGMMGTEANQRPEAFWNADLEVATERLVAIIREARPSVLISYDPNGNYGHPDHINAYRIARAAFEASGDPARYPSAGVPHTVAKRYEIAFSREHWFAVMREMVERGIPLPWDFSADEVVSREADALNPSNVEAMRRIEEDLAAGEEPPETFGTPEARITTRVDVAAFLGRKRACMDCHRTQRQDMGWVLDLPADLADRVLSPELFVLVDWRGREGEVPWPLPEGYREESLFAGL
jgi:N-acetyl-1-D-myo-inositol-2-amino-2-deoxy-alpha-D-glucopyranoside deacetylase